MLSLTAELAHFLASPCLALSDLLQLHALILRRNLAASPLLLAAFNRAIRAFSKPHPFAALRLYSVFLRSSLSPNNFTIPFLLNASAALSLLPLGSELHSRSLRTGLLPFLPVANALIDMYGKCGDLSAARKVFDEMRVRDVVSFNALLGAHARVGVDMAEARRLFDEMPQRNAITWNAMVVGYVNCGDLRSARTVFDEMPARNLVSWTVMLMGYTKGGLMDDASELFDEMPERNLVAWTMMITGNSQSGRPEKALALFREMEKAGVEPDAAAMVGVISASAQIGHAELANWVGSYVDQKAIERNERVLTALVDMHAKCGNVDQACRLFDEIPVPDAFSYTALINGLASHGHALRALELFDRMRDESIKLDPITFVGVLTACSHSGLVDEGLKFWRSMVHEYKIEPWPDHYACIVDMLGRAGRLEEAHDMVKSMVTGSHAGALGSLLAACRTYGNAEIAENVAQELFVLEPENTGNYVLLSSIYASKEQWGDAARVRSMIKERRVKKLPGYSWVEDPHREQKLQTKAP
ncbi:putative tetratricopeptide-like helical domain superfamily [Dioscorea sansibarensis]